MKKRRVIITSEMQDDLFSIYRYISRASSSAIARRYDHRIRAHCHTFDLGGERGTRRDDLRPGLRITGFEGRVTLLFTVTEDEVVFLRAFYGGQDWEADQNDAITD